MKQNQNFTWQKSLVDTQFIWRKKKTQQKNTNSLSKQNYGKTINFLKRFLKKEENWFMASVIPHRSEKNLQTTKFFYLKKLHGLKRRCRKQNQDTLKKLSRFRCRAIQKKWWNKYCDKRCLEYGTWPSTIAKTTKLSDKKKWILSQRRGSAMLLRACGK